MVAPPRRDSVCVTPTGMCNPNLTPQPHTPPPLTDPFSSLKPRPRILATFSPRAHLPAALPAFPLGLAAHLTRGISTTGPAYNDPTTSATQALTFKRRLPHKPYAPLNKFRPARPKTAEEAVTNILYNTPEPVVGPEARHVLNCLVQNEPGVLSRVSGILAGRGFNIDSLVVAKTEVSDLSRMTIIFRGKGPHIEQARRQLEDL
ncbi:hypothetical protein BC938DRAFT_473036, partial [Jimgerdemannia flammicorona]